MVNSKPPQGPPTTSRRASRFKNVFNIFTGKPIRAARKRRKSVEVPELQTRQNVQEVIDFLTKTKHKVTDIVLAVKTDDHEHWVCCEALPETQAYLAHLILSDLGLSNILEEELDETD